MKRKLRGAKRRQSHALVRIPAHSRARIQASHKARIREAYRLPRRLQHRAATRMQKKKAARGYLGEGPCSPDIDDGQFDSWKKSRRVLGAFFGHDHLNDFSGYVDGIYLAQHKTAGFRAYTDGCRSCVRLLTLDENDLGSFEQELRHFKEFGLECECLGPIFKRISDRQSTNMHIAAKILGAAQVRRLLRSEQKYIIKAKLGKKEKIKWKKAQKLGKLIAEHYTFRLHRAGCLGGGESTSSTPSFSHSAAQPRISRPWSRRCSRGGRNHLCHVGTLSDKLGRRKVFICAGYVAWGGNGHGVRIYFKRESRQAHRRRPILRCSSLGNGHDGNSHGLHNDLHGLDQQ